MGAWVREQESFPSPSKATTLGRVRPLPWLGSIVELALKAWCPMSQIQGNGNRRADLLPMVTLGGLLWGSAGELALVVPIRESKQADCLSYHPGPDPGL